MRCLIIDFLFEIIFELLFELGGEVASDKKISKWIRYPILAIILLFILIVIGGLMLIGIGLIDENLLAALFFIFLSLLFLVGFIFKFRKEYNKNKVTIVDKKIIKLT